MSSLAKISIRFRADLKQFSSQMQNVERSLKSVGKRMTKVGKNLTVGLTAPIGGLGVLAVKTFATFEQSMAKVEAISGATSNELIALTKSAEDLGASTRFAATDVAGLQLEFSKLGFDPSQILDATEATLALAQASGEDLAQSATVAASTVQGFGLQASETGRVVDVMAKSFSSSALDLTKFQTAMATVAPVAKSAGQSIETTTGMLAVLTNNGLDASTAGTGLRNIFLDIAKAGLTMEEALDMINTSTNKNVTAMDLFGKRGATVATVLAENQEAAKGFTKEFENAAGSAKAMAKIMDDTTEGSFMKFKSAAESAGIAVGEILAPMIRDLTDTLAEIISEFKDLAPATQKLIVGISALAAAIGPVLVALGFLMTTVIPGLITAFGILKVAMLATPFGLIAAGIGVAVSAFYLFNRETEKVVESQDQLTEVTNRATDAIAKEKAKVEQLLFTARDENVSKQQRIKAIQELNSISPKYLGNLNLETINTDEATTAVNKYNEALLKTAKVKAAQEKLQEIQAKIIEKELELSARRKAVTDAQALSFKTGRDNAQAAAAKKEQLAQAEKLLAIETANGTKELKAQAAELIKIINLNDTLISDPVDSPVKPTGKGGRPQIQSVSTLQSRGLMSTGIGPQLRADGEIIDEETTKINENLAFFKIRSREILEQASLNFAEGFGAIIGNIARGNVGIEALLGLMLETFGNVAIRLGKLAISIGLAVEGIKKALTSLNPAAALAAGIALIALGTIAKSAAANIAESGGSNRESFADGGIVSGPVNALVGEYAGARSNPEVIAPLDKLKSMLGNSVGGDMRSIQVEGKIKGQDIILQNARATNYRNRRG
jgi:TP901 family phage tail tape measure protein